MINNEEEIIQALEIPYRLINICSGDLNDTAAKNRFRSFLDASSRHI